ncbi:MAG: 2,3,4,5-tetrahydropyridine-2,6-carboxylate N-succinyltransferase [Epsilonproteobacteria bacterium]|nr:MAG: 2,3,4,5-tetrahydropyridine-2,6-carboxylate N-succinyltransferase [Campylobacterota bacterium]
MIQNEKEFKQKVQEIQNQPWYKKPIGFGIARVDRGQLDNSKILQATYPVVNWGENDGSAAVFLHCLNKSGAAVDCTKSELVCDTNEKFVSFALDCFAPYLDEAVGLNHKNVQVVRELEGKDISNYKAVFVFEDAKPLTVEAVYLKLYALSLGKANIRSLNIDGAFGLLENCAWSGTMPIELDWLRANEVSLKMTGQYPVLDMVDKFPRFLTHIIPAQNTRVLDTSKVRFGARLADGTTVMPGASYINFNAGTLGAVMVEGRISSSAIVGAGSDIGGGASILGVLSGTDGNPISIGENTLLGANSTTGIALGDGCIVDGGLAIFEGTKISINDENIKKLQQINTGLKLSNIIKAKELQGACGVHFRQDSLSGKIIAKRSEREIKLNKDLHD